VLTALDGGRDENAVGLYLLTRPDCPGVPGQWHVSLGDALRGAAWAPAGSRWWYVTDERLWRALDAGGADVAEVRLVHVT
jgi:hypothetical protein